MVDKWECPEGTGVPLITMPNVVKPLHRVAPRNIMGQTAWNILRKQCYYNANYKCEICGAELVGSRKAAHELYSYDYKNGDATFERAIAVCSVSHDFIHSGRLITMFKNGNVLYPKQYVLKVVEHGFKLVYEYNKKHPNKQLRVYGTFLEYLKEPELELEMKQLIKKYKVMFYIENERKSAKWGEWKLVVDGKEYPSPYKNQRDWQAAMDQAAKNDTHRKVKNPFVGEAYDLIDVILKEQE